MPWSSHYIYNAKKNDTSGKTTGKAKLTVVSSDVLAEAE
jgi:hypothetical protein